MKTIIHDMAQQDFEALMGPPCADDHIIYDRGKIKICAGCFGCWVKDPGRCVVKDGYHDTGVFFSKSEEVIIVSRLVYGSYSPFVKNVLDRAIGYVHPHFIIRKGHMHHKPRYTTRFNLSVYFYGEISQPEKITALKLVAANGINLNVKSHRVRFFSCREELRGICL